MVVEPSARDIGDAVVPSDGRLVGKRRQRRAYTLGKRECRGGGAHLREEAGEDVADDTADGVAREDVEAVVVAEQELELRRPVAQRARHEAEQHRRGRADESVHQVSVIPINR